MAKNPSSRACPPKESKVDKKKAEFLPAYEAYRGWLSRYLGLHQLYASNYGEWLITFLLLIGAGTGFLLAYNEDLINPNHARYCCYPASAAHGSLGACNNPNASVHSVTSKIECPLHGAVSLICLTIAGALLLANYVYIQVTRTEFLKSGDKYYDKLLAFYKTIQGGQNENARYEKLYDYISENAVITPVVLLPESFFFGTHLLTLGRTGLFWLYNLFFWGGGILAVLFFTTALPLDNAWRCYPDPSIFATTLGRCDVAHTPAARRFHTRSDEHLLFFWITLGIWVGMHTFVISVYGYTVFEFRKLYVQHVERRLRKHAK